MIVSRSNTSLTAPPPRCACAQAPSRRDGAEGRHQHGPPMPTAGQHTDKLRPDERPWQQGHGAATNTAQWREITHRHTTPLLTHPLPRGRGGGWLEQRHGGGHATPGASGTATEGPGSGQRQGGGVWPPTGVHRTRIRAAPAARSCCIQTRMPRPGTPPPDNRQPTTAARRGATLRARRKQEKLPTTASEAEKERSQQ